MNTQNYQITKLMLRLKFKIDNNFLIWGWGGMGIVSNWYLYEC